ncbi:MAG: hypothetical protein ACT6R2_21290, partial [Blastomonas fulva]|uniref:hypothetical protein n=1 Tax=Blastomonas fulva TaxID=1550728 RepID=UPI004033249D
LIAMGLTLQYGVARIMNLAYGQMLIAAAFAAYALFTTFALSPLLGLLLIAPAAFVSPGLTLAVTFGLFLLVLIIRPTGMFGKAGA